MTENAIAADRIARAFQAKEKQFTGLDVGAIPSRSALKARALMNFINRLPLAFWLTAAVVVVAVISHLFSQPHDLTLVVTVVSACLLIVDYLITSRDKD